MKFSEKEFNNKKELSELNPGDYFIDCSSYHYIVTDYDDEDEYYDMLVVCLENGEAISMKSNKVVEQIYIDEIIFRKVEGE